MRPLLWREKQSKWATPMEFLVPEAVSYAFPRGQKKKNEHRKKLQRKQELP